MRKLFSALLLVLMLWGCAQSQPEQKQYNATFLTLFDTVTTIVGRAESPDAFREKAQAVHDALLEYHRLFDVYNDYEGLNNLKTVNDAAGDHPVEVDRRIIDLLLECKSYYEMTGGKVNCAMGSVLQLWHEARSDSLDDPVHAYLPEDDALVEAGGHMDFSNVVIDEENSTVFITDPHTRLDVGAVAKGWSVQQVADRTEDALLISVGGNVCATGPKDESGTAWVVGIQDPNGGDQYLHTIYLSKGSVVTSGDYQRYFMVGDQIYHHIIDPQTLYPSGYWHSVSIVCEDSGLADALSTALFLLPLEEGTALLESCSAEAVWVDFEGNMFYSNGFEKLIRT